MMLSAAAKRILGQRVTGYARALDMRAWPAFRALLCDEVVLDYGAIGSIVGPIDADSWTARCQALSGFDATLHRISNLDCGVAGDTAVADSYVDALHFISTREGVLVGHLTGRYRHGFRRSSDGDWKIASCTLSVAGYPNGQENFARAFAAARARFAGEMV